MGAQDPTELVVASNGDLFVGPVGVTLPDGIDDDLSPNFIKCGLLSEDGATLTRTPEIQEFKSWQKRSATRRELVGEEISAAFALQQWNAANFKFAFGGGEITDLGGDAGFRYDFLGDSAVLAENALILVWSDGPKNYRLVMPRGNVTDATETQLVRSALAILPVNFKALSPGDGEVTAYLLTDDPNFGDGVVS
jgi:hypothetical protein